MESSAGVTTAEERHLSTYAEGLEENAKRRYRDKIKLVGGFDPMLGPPKNATTVIPPVDASDLVSYLVLASLLPSFPASTAFALNRLPSTSTSPTPPMPTAADSLFCLPAASYLVPPVQPVAGSADSSGQPVCEFCLNTDPHLVLRTCRYCGIRYHHMCQLVDESGKRCNKCCFEEG